MVIFFIILPLVGLILGWTIRWLYARFQLSSAEQKAVRVVQEALREAEVKKKEVLLETKDQLLREKNSVEKEARDRRSDLQRTERRVLAREENLEKKTAALDKQEKALTNRERALEEKELGLAHEEERWRSELERISGLTSEEARNVLVESLSKEAREEAQVLINRIEQEAKQAAERRSREILLTAIQRVSTEVSSEFTVTSVSLPSDEMKGRIIGREGRNIRTLETLTGVDVIIDDTPEAVVISCFDPVRKEIARTALERLISDGRIHPARIEEVVQRVTKETNQMMVQEAEKHLYELGIHNISQEGVRSLGKLHYRSSYGQNLLVHSREVAMLAGAVAAEVGADVDLAKRAGMLHDIGKAVDSTGDAGYVEAGAELARKMGEDPRVVNAIAAQDGAAAPQTLEAVVVQIANELSTSRPGARRDLLESYIKRLESLERIAREFEGVQEVFAIQAGRELRVLVNNATVDDSRARDLAREIARRIEQELRYPGRIKVTIVREKRLIEYAR